MQNIFPHQMTILLVNLDAGNMSNMTQEGWYTTFFCVGMDVWYL